VARHLLRHDDRRGDRRLMHQPGRLLVRKTRASGLHGRGTLSAGALEASNVDVGEEMVSMIQHQRAFSANSKVISAADDLLSQLMQLKR